MTKEEFLKEMTWFLEYYDKKFNDTQTRIWYEALKDISHETLNKLFNEFIRKEENPFIPSLGRISNFYKEKNHIDLKGNYIP